jgi:hypothetical protein
MTYTQDYLLPWANRPWLLYLGSVCAHMYDIAWSCECMAFVSWARIHVEGHDIVSWPFVKNRRITVRNLANNNPVDIRRYPNIYIIGCLIRVESVT